MTMKLLEGGGIPSDAVKLAVPGKTNAIGQVVVSGADLRPYRVMQASDEEPSLDIDQSHYVPLDQVEAIEARFHIENVPAPTAEANVMGDLPPSMARNNFSGALGYEFTIDTSQVLMSLDRPIGSMFLQDHLINVWSVETQAIVATATVTISSPVVDGRAVETLATPVVLTPGTYRVVSEESTGLDNWADAANVTNLSSDLVINQAVFKGGAIGYPTSVQGTTTSAFIWIGMQFAEHEVQLQVTSSDNQPIAIDWGNGGGYVLATSAVISYGVYPEAITAGYITIKLEIGQFITSFFAQYISNNPIRITSEQIAKINQYNHLKFLAYENDTADVTDISKELKVGSALTSYTLKTPINLPHLKWHEYLNRCENLTFLYLNINYIDSGEIDLNELQISPDAGYLRFKTDGFQYSGDYGAFVNKHPLIYRIEIEGAATSTVNIDTTPNFYDVLQYIGMDLPLTTAQVDEILSALATRSTPSWTGPKTVLLTGQCAAPSPQGFLDKAIIEAQTGSPTVTVTSSAYDVDLAVSGAISTVAKDNAIESLPPTMGRNDFNGAVGYEFTIDRTQVLMSLSRPIGTVFAQNHEINVWDTSDQLSKASVTITPSSTVVDGFAVEDLVAPIQLPPGTYRITSEEFDTGDNWEDNSSIVGAYSSDISITNGVYASGYTYPNLTSGGLNKAFVWLGMQFAEPAITLNITNSDAQDYEINWGNGAGFVDAANAIEEGGVYTSAYTGNVTVRFASGQFPIEFELDGTAWSVSGTALTELNAHNTLETFNTRADTLASNDPKHILKEGSKISYYKVAGGDSQTDSDTWAEDFSVAPLTYLHVLMLGSSYAIGTLNLNNLTLDATNRLIYLRQTAVDYTGDMAGLFTRHPILDYLVLIASNNSSATVDSIPAFPEGMRYLDIEIGLETSEVDLILQGLAERTNPSWSANKYVDLTGNMAPPSAQGLVYKDIIEEQTGNPTVTVNT